jgi:hypothetical protein
MSETTDDQPNIDPAEAQARLDQLEENIQQERREAEEHGTLGPVADDGEQRFVDDGDIDDEMNTQGIAPPA